VIVHGGKDDHASWMSPLKIFEYMAAGKPIISSDLAVLREILVHEENALLCDPDDIEGWVNSVDRLRRDPQLMLSLATAARYQFDVRHTWEKRAAAVVAPLIGKSQIERQ
jgi:glycosyltransferase involved in cell wall biosynthesis